MIVKRKEKKQVTLVLHFLVQLAENVHHLVLTSSRLQLFMYCQAVTIIMNGSGSQSDPYESGFLISTEVSTTHCCCKKPSLTTTTTLSNPLHTFSLSLNVALNGDFPSYCIIIRSQNRFQHWTSAKSRVFL